MKKISAQFLGGLISVLSATSAFAADPLPAPVPKPLQLVELAFDGSEMANRWEQTRAFAKQYPVKFTYFASGVMFIGRTKSSQGGDPGTISYWGPQHTAGHSDIGFSTYQAGNTLTNQPLIVQRVQEANAAMSEGHEIGSHLNGHFESHSWSASDWQQEFNDFWQLLYDPVYPGSRGQGPKLDRSNFLHNLLFTRRTTTGGTFDPLKDKNAVVGFRAPLLAWNPAMYPVFEKAGFLYDTSRVAQQNYWPQKIDGKYWNFPLAQIFLKGCVGGPHGRVVFDISNFRPDANGKYPDQNQYVNIGLHDPLGANEISYQEQCDTVTMDYNLLVAQSDEAHRVAPTMIMGVNETERRTLKLFENQIVDTYRDYFKSNYKGNRAPVNIGHHFALWNSGIYWNAMQRVAKEVCVLSDVRCIKYKDLMQYMEHVTPAEMAAYRAGRFTDQDELQLKLTRNEAPVKGDRQVSSLTRTAYEKCMDRFSDSICDKILNVDKDLAQVRARVDHLRLPVETQAARVDFKRLDIDKARAYAWLLKKDKQERPFLTQMITFTKEELHRLMPPSRALECEGGDDECVGQINAKVRADGGGYSGN